MAWALVLGMTPVAGALERCTELRAGFAGDRVGMLELAGLRGRAAGDDRPVREARREMARSRGAWRSSA